MFNKKKNNKHTDEEQTNDVLPEVDTSEITKIDETLKEEHVLDVYRFNFSDDSLNRVKRRIHETKEAFLKDYERISMSLEDVVSFSEEQQEMYDFLNMIHFNHFLDTSYQYHLKSFYNYMFSSEPVVIKDAILHSETTKHIRLYELQTHRTEVLYDAYKPEGNYIESFIDEYQKGLSSEPSAFELVSMKHTKHYDEKGDMFEIKAQLELDLKLGNTVFFNVYVNIYFYYKVTEVFDATVDYRSNVTIDDTHFFIVRRNRLLEEINQLTFSDRLKHIDHTYFSHQLLLNVKHDFKKKWLDYLHKSGFKQFFYQEIDDITEFCAFRLRASLKNIERYQFDVDLLSNEDISILYEAISECSENGLYINFNVLKEAVSESVVEHTAFSKKTLDNIENKDNQVVIDLPELMSSNEFKYEAILHTCYVNVCVFTIDLKTKKKRNLAIVRFSLSEK